MESAADSVSARSASTSYVAQLVPRTADNFDWSLEMPSMTLGSLGHPEVARAWMGGASWLVGGHGKNPWVLKKGMCRMPRRSGASHTLAVCVAKRTQRRTQGGQSVEIWRVVEAGALGSGKDEHWGEG